MREVWMGFLDYKFDKPMEVELIYKTAYVEIIIPELGIGGRGFEFEWALQDLKRRFERELRHNKETRWSELRHLNGIREKAMEDSQ
ncbi:MAG: hypothetical protein QXL94_05595 [Candidatus Parvarchaeum sp.]